MIISSSLAHTCFVLFFFNFVKNFISDYFGFRVPSIACSCSLSCPLMDQLSATLDGLRSIAMYALGSVFTAHWKWLWITQKVTWSWTHHMESAANGWKWKAFSYCLLQVFFVHLESWETTVLLKALGITEVCCITESGIVKPLLFGLRSLHQ